MGLLRLVDWIFCILLLLFVVYYIHAEPGRVSNFKYVNESSYSEHSPLLYSSSPPLLVEEFDPPTSMKNETVAEITEIDDTVATDTASAINSTTAYHHKKSLDVDSKVHIPFSLDRGILRFLDRSEELVEILHGQEGDGRPILIVEPSMYSGLGNRLRVVVSAAILCLATNVSLRIHYSEFFQIMRPIFLPLKLTFIPKTPPMQKISAEIAIILKERFSKGCYWYHDVFPASITWIESFVSLSFLVDANEYYQQQLKSLGFPRDDYDRYLHNFIIQPIPDISKLVRKLSKPLYHKRSICLHVRTGGKTSNSRETDTFFKGDVLAAVRRQISEIQGEMKWDPSESISMYVATDSSFVLENLMNGLPSVKLFYNAKYSRCHTRVQHGQFTKLGCVYGAIVDFLVLSNCPVLIKTKESSFSDLSEHLGENGRLITLLS